MSFYIKWQVDLLTPYAHSAEDGPFLSTAPFISVSSVKPQQKGVLVSIRIIFHPLLFSGISAVTLELKSVYPSIYQSDANMPWCIDQGAHTHKPIGIRHFFFPLGCLVFFRCWQAFMASPPWSLPSTNGTRQGVFVLNTWGIRLGCTYIYIYIIYINISYICACITMYHLF